MEAISLGLSKTLNDLNNAVYCQGRLCDIGCDDHLSTQRGSVRQAQGRRYIVVVELGGRNREGCKREVRQLRGSGTLNHRPDLML